MKQVDIDVAVLPAGLSVPRAGEVPVFAEPWEARTFALVVELNRQGLFAWKEFSALFAEELARSENLGLCRAYYLNWHIAAERLIEGLGLAGRLDVDAAVAELRPDDRTIRLR